MEVTLGDKYSITFLWHCILQYHYCGRTPLHNDHDESDKTCYNFLYSYRCSSEGVAHEFLFFNDNQYLNMCSGQRCGLEFIECQVVINRSFGNSLGCPSRKLMVMEDSALLSLKKKDFLFSYFYFHYPKVVFHHLFHIEWSLIRESIQSFYE